MPTYVRLSKIESNHHRVRTDTIDGVCENPPREGFSYVMLSSPLEQGFDLRLLTTSIVQKIYPGQNGALLFKTENSTYLWEPLSEHSQPEVGS